MKKYLNMTPLYIAAAIIAVSAFMLPRVIEAINLHIHGIAYIAEQTEEYYKITEPIDGEYTVELDLKDLESNKGKILYDDKGSQISVLTVTSSEKDKYEVIFRSHGTERPDGAALISGVDHAFTDTAFVHTIKAEAEASFDGGETVELIPSSSTGLSYPDGDSFGFYLQTSAEDGGTLTLTVTNLQLNLWAKKWDIEDYQ